MKRPDLLSKPAVIPDLYIITDRHATGGRDLVDVMAQALAVLSDPAVARLDLRVAVQLREKDLPTRPLLELAESLRAVTHRAGAGLFINGRVDVALAVAADGVHLGHGALPVAEVRKISKKLSIGVSTHRASEVEQAQIDGVDFVVWGPVFKTPSKVGVIRPKGLQGLTQATAVDIPVLALGGIDASNIVGCIQSGARGVACIRSVNNCPDPGAATRTLLEAIRKQR